MKLFDESKDAIGGMRRLRILATGRRIEEDQFLAEPDSVSNGIVVFSGIRNYFEDLLDESTFLRDSLMYFTRPEQLPSVNAPGICVHVRFGDLIRVEPGKPAPDVPRWHHRQPIDWYLRSVYELREAMDQEVPVWVFSDGSDEELQPLLAMHGVRRVFFGSAIADLLTMSTAKVLVASGSTFSMWAAFLGRMPVIWPPNGRRHKLHGSNWEYEIELNGRLPEQVAQLVRQQAGTSVPPSKSFVRA